MYDDSERAREEAVVANFGLVSAFVSNDCGNVRKNSG
jgi:hypothetical protein